MKCDIYQHSWIGGEKCEVKIKGKTYECSSGGQSLGQWVKLNWMYFYGLDYQVNGQALTVLCVDCYKKVFGQYPMPSTYQGNKYGKLEHGVPAEAPPEEYEEFHFSPLRNLIFPDDSSFESFVRKAVSH